MSQSPSSSPADPRRGPSRRLQNRPVTSADAHPSVTGAVTVEEALPGELTPLTYRPGRETAVTRDEALGSARRRHRSNKAAGRPYAKGESPDELPAADAAKVNVMQRLPPLAMSLAKARAEIEDTNVTAVTEEALIRYAAGVPDDPAFVAQEQAEVLRWFATQDNGPHPHTLSLTPIPGLVPADRVHRLAREAAARGMRPCELLTLMMDRAFDNLHELPPPNSGR